MLSGEGRPKPPQHAGALRPDRTGERRCLSLGLSVGSGQRLAAASGAAGGELGLREAPRP